MTEHRRRFLQILAAAPFAPWKEILRELAKPRVAYSIPLNAGRIDKLDLEHWGAVGLDGSFIEAGKIVHTYGTYFDVGEPVTLYKGDGKVLGKFKVSYVDGIGRAMYLDSVPLL